MAPRKSTPEPATSHLSRPGVDLITSEQIPPSKGLAALPRELLQQIAAEIPKTELVESRGDWRISGLAAFGLTYRHIHSVFRDEIKQNTEAIGRALVFGKKAINPLNFWQYAALVTRLDQEKQLQGTSELLKKLAGRPVRWGNYDWHISHEAVCQAITLLYDSIAPSAMPLSLRHEFIETFLGLPFAIAPMPPELTIDLLLDDEHFERLFPPFRETPHAACQLVQWRRFHSFFCAVDAACESRGWTQLSPADRERAGARLMEVVDAAAQLPQWSPWDNVQALGPLRAYLGKAHRLLPIEAQAHYVSSVQAILNLRPDRFNSRILSKDCIRMIARTGMWESLQGPFSFEDRAEAIGLLHRALPHDLVQAFKSPQDTQYLHMAAQILFGLRALCSDSAERADDTPPAQEQLSLVLRIDEALDRLPWGIVKAAAPKGGGVGENHLPHIDLRDMPGMARVFRLLASRPLPKQGEPPTAASRAYERLFERLFIFWHDTACLLLSAETREEWERAICACIDAIISHPDRAPLLRSYGAYFLARWHDLQPPQWEGLWRLAFERESEATALRESLQAAPRWIHKQWPEKYQCIGGAVEMVDYMDMGQADPSSARWFNIEQRGHFLALCDLIKEIDPPNGAKKVYLARLSMQLDNEAGWKSWMRAQEVFQKYEAPHLLLALRHFAFRMLPRVQPESRHRWVEHCSLPLLQTFLSLKPSMDADTSKVVTRLFEESLVGMTQEEILGHLVRFRNILRQFQPQTELTHSLAEALERVARQRQGEGSLPLLDVTSRNSIEQAMALIPALRSGEGEFAYTHQELYRAIAAGAEKAFLSGSPQARRKVALNCMHAASALMDTDPSAEESVWNLLDLAQAVKPAPGRRRALGA